MSATVGSPISMMITVHTGYQNHAYDTHVLTSDRCGGLEQEGPM